MSFIAEALSRMGGRELNEDSYGFLEMNRAACWVVADGLGGHRGGETASKVAVDAVLASFRAAPSFSIASLQTHLEAAQQAVLKAQKEQPTLSTMRTTIVILISDSQRALWAHVGDSRLYCIENGHIVSCTKDHSVVQAMVSAGEMPASRIRHHEDRNRLLRCLGNAEADFRPTILSEPRSLNSGIAFLLCTDGFWENVTESEIEVDFAKGDGAKDWLALMEGRLLERATDSDDNYTAIAIRVDSEPAQVSADATLVSAQRKQHSTNRLRLARIVGLAVLLIAVSLLIAGAWTRLRSLENQVQEVTNEKNNLQKELSDKQLELENEQQSLNDLRKQLKDCDSRGGTGAAHTHTGHAPGN
jgi:serine/threonine protein phosphatase PrpC